MKPRTTIKFRYAALLIILVSAGSAFVYPEREDPDLSSNAATGMETANHSRMQIGISYYPERETPAQWAVDYQIMKEAGIKRIRIGEFAWSTLEPDEGKYNWEWLDKCIELAADYDLQVVLCTPTAAPPLWLTEKYPDVLPVNETGYQNPHGCRQHRCGSAR